MGQRQLEVPNCQKEAIGCRRLELKFHSEWDPGRAVLTEADGEVVFEMGRDRLAEFEKGLRDILSGDGDWAMSGDIGLWFW